MAKAYWIVGTSFDGEKEEIKEETIYLFLKKSAKTASYPIIANIHRKFVSDIKLNFQLPTLNFSLKMGSVPF